MKTRLIWMALAAAAPTAAFAQGASPPKPAPAPTSKPAGHTVGEVVVTGQAPAVQTSIDRRSYSVSGDL
ncbi:MAG: hypothetical protein JWR47_3050, partial [Phenylobacterium sp.]|nr:hypothetical protein [Phenylobacterium sp.]